PAVHLTLGAGNCEPGTLTLTWEAGGVERTATAAADGTLSGDGTGRVVHATGEVELRPTLLPDAASTLLVEYEAGDMEEELFTPSKSGGDIVLALADLRRAGTLWLQYNASVLSVSGISTTVTRVII